ncbi:MULTISPECIES: OmpP1/FadL family transporter [Roseobacteraceae]|uniref:Outer membrane protein transport protein (OMPP1/FadL/TodX) n=1 Tax=Pseudosulfitobacter pseudonitzschiae TaxID=1402135 RepID=A0A221K0E6_9RHOB|nr:MULTISPECIES: outer membrane protein transport protein [Roseobacteraceae]ASM72465.1 outer membrane protein transport protein (OMPP1/FadL/TodX) [Pseudosulfitobacter pseudonitzschiae]
MTVKHIAIAALLGSACTAQAGGIDRSGQSILALFESGRYAEFSLGAVSPDTSGTSVVGLGGAGSGDMTSSFLQLGAAYKADINDRLSYAIIYDQPFGADVDYPAGTGYYAAGAAADLDAHAITGLLRYKFQNNFSVHGGVRVQSIEATAAIPFIGGYAVNGARDIGVGYVAGVAYERPDIALRVALTYNSGIEHDVETTESFGGAPLPTTTTQIETPQSINLDFRTGIAQDTLLFGGIRWAEWSEFDITPVGYAGATGGASLVSYDNDVFTYSLGVGRRLNENWSVSASVGFEKSNGGFASNLGPTDGFKSLALAAVYTQDNMKITTGIRYINIGDAQTAIPGFAPAANFEDNHAVAIGVKVGYNF